MSGHPKVLVVDDEADDACLLAIGLRMEGFEVEAASDARRALDVMTGEAFDLVVADLMMPGTNGIQLARMIRERFPDARVVLMSAYPLSERQLVLADCGAVGFAAKPFEAPDLGRFLRGKLAPADPRAPDPAADPFTLPGAM
jgi:two-component system phosphate regulon response regulator OmpR